MYCEHLTNYQYYLLSSYSIIYFNNLNTILVCNYVYIYIYTYMYIHIEYIHMYSSYLRYCLETHALHTAPGWLFPGQKDSSGNKERERERETGLLLSKNFFSYQDV